MLNYKVYQRNEGEKQYISRGNTIDTHEPLVVGKHTTYKQFGLTRAIIDKVTFEGGHKVYLTIKKDKK